MKPRWLAALLGLVVLALLLWARGPPEPVSPEAAPTAPEPPSRPARTAPAVLELAPPPPVEPLPRAPEPAAPPSPAPPPAAVDAGAEVELDAGPRFPPTLEGLQAALASRSAEVVACRDAWRALGTDDLPGSVHFRVRAGLGTVSVRLHDGGVAARGLETCILGALAELRFEPSEAELRVELTLQPPDDGG